MSKIVQAVNAMISNSDKISNVRKNDSEIFFMYNNKHKWSIKANEDSYVLWYYPGDISIDVLVQYEGHDWENTPMVSYSTSDLGTKEAKASFADLYMLVKERVYGVNQVLDEIIGDDDF